MNSLLNVVALIAIVIPVHFGHAQSPSKNVGSTIFLKECTVVLIKDIDLPALESGQLTEILVKPGDNVSIDQKVAQMDDMRSRNVLEEAQLRFQIADDRANDSTEVKAAQKRYKLAFDEHKKMARLRKSGSMSVSEAERAKVTAELEQLRWRGAQKAMELAAVEAAAEKVTVQASEHSIQRHALESPIVGQVYEVNREAGEWVTAGETIMKIARMDRLRISSHIDGNRYNPHEIADRPVTVKLMLPGEQEVEFRGQVVFVGSDRGLKDQAFAVWAEVDNKTHDAEGKYWILNPGHWVSMEIFLDKPVAQSAAVSSTQFGSDPK